MTLGLQIAGRPRKPVTAEVERELTFEDVESLMHERGTPPTPTIIHLRERHHALARDIAAGKKPGEAAILHRYTRERITQLMGDPAFLELVEHYRELVNEEFIDFQKKLAELALDAAHIMQSRMEEKPDELSDALVLQIIQVGADRTGHGPSQKTEVNIKVGLADRLAQAQRRSIAARDITPPEEAE